MSVDHIMKIDSFKTTTSSKQMTAPSECKNPSNSELHKTFDNQYAKNYGTSYGISYGINSVMNRK